ncbi:BgtA-20863 [Blumeria graminis f. sp. tritici]|uniref:BgtA-20863 n=2 Tax=Blumeria graminis f. sp. tritici TaxID=62690 RepID=A0A9X9L9V9_BLUGR|nr:hypothetical protein BGT96224_A20863 [Blumeria graminis f. sp. tritici 96224]VCU40100.1 BgtA-20863 [Blumeria graminis f. sp. tritici]
MSSNAAPRPWTKVLYPSQSCGNAPTPAMSLLNLNNWPQSLTQSTTKLPPSIQAVQDSNNAGKTRTLIICLDGTGDQFDDDNSNVVNFVACLKKDDPNQITYYQSGIGTYNEHGLKNGISAAIDMSVGSGLGIHIKDAYRFLMQNYREGDKICLFGFSRGSYTVRCLAGMLHKVGLLPAHNSAQINFAYNFYKNDSAEGWKMSREFKKTFCADVNVYFVGVWDCVASVGFIPRKLPFSKSPTNSIGFFRHAMALDEHRSKFKVCHFAHSDPASIPSNARTSRNRRHYLPKALRKSDRKPEKKDDANKEKSNTFTMKRVLTFPQLGKEEDDQEKLEAEFEKSCQKSSPPTDVLEVWFCGGHADVGGGAVKNWERHVLARIPLRWMIRQCFECNTGILFKTSSLAETGIDIHSVWPVYKAQERPRVGPSPDHMNKYAEGGFPPLQRRPALMGIELDEEGTKLSPGDLLPEQTEDYFDALAPINDQLKLARMWWLLEFWPVKIRIQNEASDGWKKVVRLNLGSHRAVRELEPKMHWTVEQRIIEKGYKMHSNVDRNAIWKVVC